MLCASFLASASQPTVNHIMGRVVNSEAFLQTCIQVVSQGLSILLWADSGTGAQSTE